MERRQPPDVAALTLPPRASGGAGGGDELLGVFQDQPISRPSVHGGAMSFFLLRCSCNRHMPKPS